MKNEEKVEEKTEISIIIPSFNRPDLLNRVLNAFSCQTVPCDKFEILAVDDASNPPLAESLYPKNFPFELKIIRHTINKGQSTARNSGLKEAKGELIIFIDDDIIPCRTFIEEHINSHAEYKLPSIAIVGMVSWSEEIPLTPLMFYLDNGGPLLGLKKFEDRSRLPFLISGNTSLNRKFLLENGLFDESFKEYGWEDIDLGYRLMGKGLKIILNKKAEAAHYKYINIESVILRQHQCGKSAYNLYKKYPDLFPGITNLQPLFKLENSNEILKKIKEIEEHLYGDYKLKPQIIPALWKEYDRLCDLYFYNGLKSRLTEEFNDLDLILDCSKKGVFAYIQGNWRKSIDSFYQIKKKCFDFFPLRWYLILSLLKNNEYDFCKEELSELLTIFPESIWGYYTLGALKEKSDHLEEAIELFEKTASLVGERIEQKKYKGGAWFHIGEIMLKLNRKKDAIKYFRCCLDVEPDHNKAKHYLTKFRSFKNSF